MANLAAQADTGKDSYDEIEIDLASGGGHGAPAGSGYVDDTTPIGTGSARRLLPRGERCSRCFRRRMVRYGGVICAGKSQFVLLSRTVFVSYQLYDSCHIHRRICFSVVPSTEYRVCVPIRIARNSVYSYARTRTYSYLYIDGTLVRECSTCTSTAVRQQ